MHREHEYNTGDRGAVGPAALPDRRTASLGSSGGWLRSLKVEVDSAREAVRPAWGAGTSDLPPAGELVVSTECRADVTILSLSGELDLATSTLLERELDTAEAARPMRLVVDLTRLEFIDSSGLNTLLAASVRASENGRPLSLRQGPRMVRRLFELTRSVQLFSFDD